VCLLVGQQRRSGVLAAAAVTAFAWWRVRRTLSPKAPVAAGSATPSARLRPPGRVAALLVGLGLVSAANQAAGMLVRHWWPAAAVGAVLSRRVRRAVLLASVATGWPTGTATGRSTASQDWTPAGTCWRTGPTTWATASACGGSAYRGSTLAPLRPEVTGLGAWLARRGRRL